MKLAIVEPDPTNADVLSFVAQRRGHHAVVVAAVGRLDERLPFLPVAVVLSSTRIDDQAVRDIEAVRRQFREAHLVVLCERPGHVGAIEAIGAGANDLMRTPVHPVELFRRIEQNAKVRNPSGRVRPGGVLGDLEVDLDAHTAKKAGNELTLTKLERRLLFCLVEHHPGVATLDRLLTFGWDSLDEPEAGLLKTHISHIRKKLSEAGGSPVEIVSHQSVGYSIRAIEVARTG